MACRAISARCWQSGRARSHSILLPEGDFVVVEAKGDNVTKTGVRYDNEYCMIWRLQNGRIREIKEYCDSALVERALGPFPADKLAKAG